MRIVSVPDRLVRDPATRRWVDADGIDIDPTDPYWARMIADRDVADPADPVWADMLAERAAARAALESAPAETAAADLEAPVEIDPVIIAAEPASRRAAKEA